MKAEGFNSEKYVEFTCKSMAKVSAGDVKDFVLFQTADSTKLNPKISRLLGFLRIGCHYHSFSRACEYTMKASPSLANKIETTQAMHRKAKKRNSISAGLDNYQEAARKMGKNFKLQA